MNSIHISPEELNILQEIFEDCPGVFVFGSRAKGTHKTFSDLDICIIREAQVPRKEIAELKDLCEESDLPFTVDIIDYNAISHNFQKIIDTDKIAFPYKT